MSKYNYNDHCDLTNEQRKLVEDQADLKYPNTIEGIPMKEINKFLSEHFKLTGEWDRDAA